MPKVEIGISWHYKRNLYISTVYLCIMQRIALIQPIVKIGKTLRIQKSPTGIQFVGAQLKKHGHKVMLFHEETTNELINKILKFNPTHIGISTMTANFLEGKLVAEKIKQKLSNIPITLGGWHASGCANSYINEYESLSLEEILNKNSPFDYIIIGEGELTFCELIKRLENKESVSDIKGIGYLNNENKIVVSRGERIKDLDSLENPIWDDLNIDKYRDLRSGELDLSIHVQRGCRFNCAYCATPDLYHNGQTRQSVTKTVQYIKYLIDKFHPDVITFTDEDFLGNLTWVEELCDKLIKININTKVKFDTFASTYDIIKADERNILKKMKLAGFNSYFVGIESLNEKTLTIYNRPLNKEKPIEYYMTLIQKAIDVSNDAGLVFLADYMIGAFWENEDDVKSGFERLKTLKNIPYVYLPILTPMPGTALWKYVIDNDLLIKNKKGNVDWDKYNASSSTVKLNYDVVNLRNKLEIEFYTSKQYIQDMNSNISKDQNKLNYYKGVFNRFCKEYPESKELKTILDSLS